MTVSLHPMIDAFELQTALDGLLQPQMFKDYCPNGLQVEGRREVRTLVSGVTASLALIEAAVAESADAILVHHGLFWRGYDGRVTGWMRKRLGLLIEHNINLYAYHLPMDAHPELGNNAQLGRQVGLAVREGASARFGEQGLGWMGQPGPGQTFSTAAQLAVHVEHVLKRPVTLVGPAQEAIKNIAWCTGGAQGYFEAAIAAGADAFLTGEISEPQAHLARECGVAFLACGHHATERFGAPAVGAYVSRQFGLSHRFIDIDNPA